MNHRMFNNSKRVVSEIGLGTWQLGGSEWGEVSQAKAFEILHQAIESGVTFFDTADVYGAGRSETLIGDFLKSRPSLRDEVFVATKLGRYPEPGWNENFTLKIMRRHTQASLQRLKREALDLTQLHCVPEEVLRDGEVFESLRILKREGLIKDFGASVETNDEAILCLAQEGIASLQIIFNIFRRQPLDFFAQAQAKNVALIVRLPLASGLLSGKFTKHTRFPATDHRNFNRDGAQFNVGETFAGLEFQQAVSLVEDLKHIAPPDISLAEFALRFTLDFPEVTTVIPGASKPAHIVANARASDLLPLDRSLHESLAQFYLERVADKIRGRY